MVVSLLFSKSGLNRDNVSTTKSVFEVKDLLPGERREVNVFIDKTFTRGIELLTPTVAPIINKAEIRKEILKKKKMWPIPKKYEADIDRSGSFRQVKVVNFTWKPQ